ncbi:TRAP transporter small permease subunit [uncultured Desulfosarcina sp.]|uniref:TRAP transporter small permease subunit n=1 Tax=uncultured Desulfosarcina sp. TaxID=218289 RepID=UPI0029C765C6|nr:TRAP transporter small permease subunit [uncultured Desulfosarcina sp.]
MKSKNRIDSWLDILDNFILNSGKIIAWANGFLILVIVLQVALRYGFNNGLVVLEELEWHLYSLAFMFGLSYAAVNNSHVRVDLFSNRFTKKTQHWIEVLGALFLMLPFIISVMIHSHQFFIDSWIHNERSVAPLGLPCRWAIKAVIPISFGFFGIAIISRMSRSLLFLFGKNHGNQ